MEQVEHNIPREIWTHEILTKEGLLWSYDHKRRSPYQDWDKLVESFSRDLILEVLKKLPLDTLEDAFQWAVKKQNSTVLKLVLEEGRVDPSGNDNCAIVEQCYHDNLDLIQLLLSDSRVDPTARDNAPIRIASSLGHVKVVKLLLSDPRINPGEYDNQAIGAASNRGHLEVVRLLLADPRVNPNDNNNYALAMACRRSNMEIIKLLLSDPRVEPKVDPEVIEEVKRYRYNEVVEFILFHINQH